MILTLCDNSKVLVVAHDAGGAEVVSSWVRQNPDYDYTFVLDGPAVGIFQNKVGSIAILHAKALTPALIQDSDVVFTSTSYGSDIERWAISMARTEGVHCISFLDHWCNYIARFQTGEDMVLPDEIWVGDEDALKIAMQCFPGCALKLVDNPYLDDLRAEFAKLPPVAPNPSASFHILYICEAAAESGKTLPSGEWHEYVSMDLFLEQLAKISKGRDVLVRVRAHPAEGKGKYARYLGRRGNIVVEMTHDNALIDDCQWSDWVVGMNSMALVVAQLGGKKVYYCNIDRQKPKHIPIRGLSNLFDAVSLG